MSDAPEGVTECGSEMVLDTVECVLPVGHDGPHRIGDLEWEGPSVWEHNKALRAENARLRRALEEIQRDAETAWDGDPEGWYEAINETIKAARRALNRETTDET